MQLLSFRKPYELLPPVPEAQMLTHGFAYQHGTFLSDIGLDDIDSVLAQDGTFVRVGLREPSASFLKKIQGKCAKLSRPYGGWSHATRCGTSSKSHNCCAGKGRGVERFAPVDVLADRFWHPAR
jgi:hypothetical protein